MQQLSDLLEIYLITYNRSDELGRTLADLLSSPFAACSITVLDNCSTDNTAARVSSVAREHPQVKHVRNATNIGAAANAVQPFLMSRTPFTWVVCDDDHFDFSEVDDVLDTLRANTAELLIVGGHAEAVRHGGGHLASARSLSERGLNFFRDTSFLPSTIYSTAFAREYIAESYAFCTFHYPHVAMLLGAYRRDVACYVSRRRLVTPSIGTQSYSQTSQMLWWFGLADTIPDRALRRRFLASQFAGPLDETGLYGLLNTLVRMKLYSKAASILPLYGVRVVGSVARMIRARASGIRYPT